MEKNEIQINVGIKINIDVSVKNTFGILLHVVAKMENI